MLLIGKKYHYRPVIFRLPVPEIEGYLQNLALGMGYLKKVLVFQKFVPCNPQHCQV